MKIAGFFTKLKNMPRKTRITVFASALAIGNILTMTSLSLAWFIQYNAESSNIKTFSGDLDIEISKISAYKYVYPYINNSAEFIDYDTPGVVKSYVVEDASIDTPNNLSNNVTFDLGIKTNQPRTTVAGEGTANKIHYEGSHNFKYYLIGDKVFNGVNDNEWSSLTATAFSRLIAPEKSETPNDNKSVTLSRVMVSAGAKFILFDVNTVGVDVNNDDAPICSYFTYNNPQTAFGQNSRFGVVDGYLKCLKSGIYDFRYRLDNSGNPHLDIMLTASGNNTIMASNLVDPTKISIEYYGHYIENPEQYDDINDYLPVGIQKQKTMVLLDVYLKFNNKNDIDAGLTIIREPLKQGQSIFSFDNKYSTLDPYTFLGYKGEENRNPLCASDFFGFYPVLMSNANVLTNGYDDPATVWNDFNSKTTAYAEAGVPVYQKFSNTTKYDIELPCSLYGDSSLIPGSVENNYYHIYVSIDYEHEDMRFFLNPDRLGKTFYLDRDFTFYFTAIQHIYEDAEQEGGEGN